MQPIWNDLRYALRQLRKAPGFTLTVLLTLALGIGANTAMFTVLEAMLLRALPIHDAKRVMYITENAWPDNVMETGNSPWTFTLPVFEQLRQQKQIFSGVIGYVPLSFGKVDVRVGHTPMTTEADMVSGNFFSMLGVPMERGRAFGLDDERRHTQVAVLSYNFWTRAFSRSPEAIGQTLFIKGIPFTILGVARRGFAGVEPATQGDFWIPLQDRADLPAWGNPINGGHGLYGPKPWSALMMMGRLAPGMTKRTAEAALNPLLLRLWYGTLGRTIPPQMKLGVTLVPATGLGPVSDQFRTPLEITMGLVLLVLLIACTNVAMLVLARNTAREREIAVRVALGAGKGTLIRQLLAEGLLLAMGGGALGWTFAATASPLLSRALATIDFQTNMTPNGSVLWFTLAVSALATVLFSLAPVRNALRVQPTMALKAGAAGGAVGRGHWTTRRILVAGQIALGVVCLFAAGLMVRTLRAYQRQDLGIRTAGLLTFGVTPTGTLTTAQKVAFYQNLIARLRALPGVESATVVENIPGAQVSDNSGLWIDGVLKSTGTLDTLLRSNTVGPDFFHVMGIPVLRGRDIAAADNTSAPHVVVVNQTLATRFFPHGDPLGHTIGPKDDAYTIVGVVRDSKYTSVDEPAMAMAWYSYAQVPNFPPMNIELRADGNPLALLPSIRRAVSQIDPNLPLENPQTQRAVFDTSYFFSTLTAGLTTFFGLLAVLLVALGLYGTLAYTVGRRTREIGVRMAVGATRGNVQWLMLRECLRMVATGIAVGVPLALIAGRLLRSQLYQLSWRDPVAVFGALLLIVLVSLAAAWLPARRAASVDPIRALRTE